MNVRQISVFLENRAGRLASILQCVTEAQCNLRAMSLSDTSDFGIVRLLVDDVDRCTATLRDRGHTFNVTEMVALEMPDRPGGLNQILDAITAAGLNVEYMYAFATRTPGKAVVIFRFEDNAVAIPALAAAGYPALTEEQVRAL
ncbi:MAG: ACT domain-containing protein [Kiritimatiellae bacterium]|nr:ACT domain-containing protein [Kiritimatiellia bacterium]MBR4189275.1 ACT domain-containing protein [Kiritimatiellia bacterium]MBR4250935.1 ACT domain-containing protein [Kiritimatiellia bacterium]